MHAESCAGANVYCTCTTLGLCAQAARAAKLDGTFHAWLSSDNIDAKDRLQSSGPWYATSGKDVVFGSTTDLAAGPKSPQHHQLMQQAAAHLLFPGLSTRGRARACASSPTHDLMLHCLL